ncbi:MAG: hypothetical protein AAF490_30800, partial [Chloroflexota bacterium]
MKQKRYLIVLMILLSMVGLIWMGGTAVAQQVPQPPNGRLIIKDGTIILMVMNTEDAKTSLEQLAEGYGAYIIQQRVWEDDRRFQ